MKYENHERKHRREDRNEKANLFTLILCWQFYNDSNTIKKYISIS